MKFHLPRHSRPIVALVSSVLAFAWAGSPAIAQTESNALAGEWEWSAPDARMQTRQFERLSIFSDGTIVRYHGTLPQKLYVIDIREQPGRWALGKGNTLSLKLTKPAKAGFEDRRIRVRKSTAASKLTERMSLKIESLTANKLVIAGPSGSRIFKRVHY